MQEYLSPSSAVYRLFASLWDPARLPDPASVPWQDVLRRVGPTNLAGLMHVVTSSMRDAMPQEVSSTLALAFYRTAAANTRCAQQLLDVGSVLSALDIPLLLLKGAAMSETLYPDPALRLIGDIDLAVPVEAVPACRQALLACGYVPSRLEERPGSLLAHSNQEQFRPPSSDQTSVELHWHILDVPYYMRTVPMAWFWEHTEELSIDGQAFRVLSVEANLVYLSSHLALHHGFRGLHSLLDLALLIVHHGDTVDWDKVIRAATDFELVSALRGTLDHLADAWPSLPLDEPRRRLASVRPSRMDARLYRLLTAPARTPTMQFYTTLVSMPGTASRARYVWTNLFPQPAYMRSRYGVHSGWQLPYWYLYRLGEGLVRLGRTLPRALRAQGKAPDATEQ